MTFKKPGILTAVYGVTRTGKGKWVISQIQKKRVSLVWDLKGDPSEYPCRWRARNIEALKKALLMPEPGMICYTGKKTDFDQFCQLAYLFAELWGAQCAIVIDETSDVTGTGKAQDTYGELLRKSLNQGADLYSMCQRAAESDKTTLANASRFHFSTPGTPDDCDRLARYLGIPRDVIHGLVPDFERHRFDCVDCSKGHWYQVSQLQFKKNKAVFVPKSEKIIFHKK